MDEASAIQLVSQFLHEHGFMSSLKALEADSGRKYVPGENQTSGHLKTILDDHTRQMKQKLALDVSPDHLFELGQGEHANVLWKSLDDVGGGVNVLVVRLINNGVLIFGAAKSVFGVTELPLCPTLENPPIYPIVKLSTLCKGAVLALDVHPKKRNLLVCGTMDRLTFILDISKPDDNVVVQKFESHSKYVVKALWSFSGFYFITASYDKTICVYRVRGDRSGLYDRIQKLHFKGVIESLAFSKGTDEFVVGVRDDNVLHCYTLSPGKAQEYRTINMNTFGDDYVSFVPMHISFSPDGQCMLISTDQDRLILYSWRTGKQIARFYGATNDELSQPRCCWDYSGKYVYGTSQDKSIVVWEVRSQEVVCKLEGHTATVRDIFFCNELKLLVSCSFDGSIKLWMCDHS